MRLQSDGCPPDGEHFPAAYAALRQQAFSKKAGDSTEIATSRPFATFAVKAVSGLAFPPTKIAPKRREIATGAAAIPCADPRTCGADGAAPSKGQAVDDRTNGGPRAVAAVAGACQAHHSLSCRLAMKNRATGWRSHNSLALSCLWERHSVARCFHRFGRRRMAASRCSAGRGRAPTPSRMVTCNRAGAFVDQVSQTSAV